MMCFTCLYFMSMSILFAPFVYLLLYCCCLYLYKQSCNSVCPAAVSCGPAPDAPANGQKINSGTTFGSTVNYTCNQGYTLQGNNTRTCMANKLWSGRAPTCNRKLLGIRCSTIDIHGHQQSIRAMILQCDDSWGFSLYISIYRHRADKQQVEWQYTCSA